jgi:hypothetical protein
MKRTLKFAGTLSIALAIGVVALAKDFVSPDQIVYDAVPGYGMGGGTEIFEWEQKAQSTTGEAAVPKALEAPAGLRIRWFGTAGFEISDDDTTILIDPFVSRPTFAQSLLLEDLPIDTEAVDKFILGPIERSPGGLKRIKAILISHTHHDHVQDAPYVLAKFPTAADRPLIAGDCNLVDILKKYRGREQDVPWIKGIEPLDKGPRFIVEFNRKQKEEPPAGKPLARPVGQFGNFKVTTFISEHGLYDDLIFTHEGGITGRPPFKGADLRARLNSTMMYLIEYKNQGNSFRIVAVDSPRGLHTARVSAEILAGGPIDVLLEGIASRVKENAIPDRITGFKPRYFVPTHFDNFFVGLDQFRVFDFQLKVTTDNSNLKGFIDGFCRGAGCPNLRMMKMFYYYSMQNLLRRDVVSNRPASARSE